MNTKILYNKKTDQELFCEVDEMGEELSPVFGFNFPKLEFNEELVSLAKDIAQKSIKYIDDEKLKEIAESVYNKDLPKITIYINTTPFSSWNLEGKYLSISYKRNTESKFFSAVCHEVNHLMYDLTFKTQKYQDTEIKETLTALNNIFGIKDLGWDKFSRERKMALDFYNQKKSFPETIACVQNLFRRK